MSVVDERLDRILHAGHPEADRYEPPRFAVILERAADGRAAVPRSRPRTLSRVLSVATFAVAAVAVVVVALNPPHISLGIGADGSHARIPPSGDEHVVVTGEGFVSFRLENEAIVVRLTRDGKTNELGRSREFLAPPPAVGTRPESMVGVFAMVCGRADDPNARRYMFGYISGGAPIRYSGPPAVGHGATDGLFLFALAPGAISSRTRPAVRPRRSAASADEIQSSNLSSSTTIGW